MKKSFKKMIVLMVIILFSTKVYSTNVEFDFGVSMFGASPIKPAVGPVFGIGISTPLFNLGLKSKMLLPDISARNRDFNPLVQSSLNLEIKHRLKTIPITLIGGLGLGYAVKTGLKIIPDISQYETIDEYNIITYPDVNPLDDEDIMSDGILFEFSAGVLFPITQHITALARVYGVYNVQSAQIDERDDGQNWKLDFYKTFDFSGGGIEFSIRYSIKPAYPLKY